MPDVVSISEAKTNLSKLVKRALAGETIYIGAYGTVQTVLGPAPAKQPIPIGVLADASGSACVHVDQLTLVTTDRLLLAAGYPTIDAS